MQGCYHSNGTRLSTPRTTMAAVIPNTESVTSESSSEKFTLLTDDLQVLIDQVMSQSHTTTMSAATSSNTWLLDTTCGNHMYADPFLFTKTLYVSDSSIITTASGSTLKVTHVGNVDTSTLYIPDIYLVPHLALNLNSVGQLCDLGLDLHFSKQYGCVQDPRTGQKVGTGCKIGTLFELESLKVPQHLISVATPQALFNFSRFMVL